MKNLTAFTFGVLAMGALILALTRPVHHCHEDEYQLVTPAGLACHPIDDGALRVIADDYRINPEE